MTQSFSAGLYTTSALADSVAGDWRIARWTPRVVHVDVDSADPQRDALVAISQAFRLEQESPTLASVAEGLGRVTQPEVLVWARGEAFADAHPKAWQALSTMLEQRIQAGTPFAVVLAGSRKR